MRTCPMNWDPGDPSRKGLQGSRWSLPPTGTSASTLSSCSSIVSSPPQSPTPPHLEKARDCPGISPPRTAASLSPVLTCLEMELIESPGIYCFSFFSLRETVTLVFISKTLFQPFNSAQIQLPRPSVNTFQHTSPQKPVWQRLCCPSPFCLLPSTIPRPPSRLGPGD